MNSVVVHSILNDFLWNRKDAEDAERTPSLCESFASLRFKLFIILRTITYLDKF